MINTASRDIVWKILKNKLLHVTEDQAQRLWADIEKYNSLIDLKELTEDSLDAVFINHKQNAKKRQQNEMDEEYPVDKLINKVFEQMKRDKLALLNPYNSTTAPTTTTAGAAPNPKQSAVSLHPTQNSFIEKTQHTKFMISKHLEACEDKGQKIKSVNEELDFKFGRENNAYLEVKKIKSDFTRNNFLYVKPQHFQDAFSNRFLEMEVKIGSYLESIGKKYDRIQDDVKSFATETIIIGRLTMDEEDSFVSERICIEYLTDKGNMHHCFLNFSSCKSEFLLFPNAYVAVGVVGDFYDISTALTVKSVFEIDSHLDASDDHVPAKREIDKFSNVLVFKGPFTQNGNAYFGGFDMILHHIQADMSASCIVLIGPFLPIEQLVEGQIEFATKNSFNMIRASNFSNFFTNLYKLKPSMAVVIVPDASEVDNIYPSPIPNTLQFVKVLNPELLTLASSPCLLSFEVGQAKYRIAINTQDIVKACVRYPSNSKDPRKFIQPMRSLVSQRCLLPIFPYVEPFDVTMIDQLSFQEEDKPDIIVCCSVMTQFACKARGTIVCNPKTIFEGDDYGSFVRIALDASSKGTDGVRVDVLKF